MSKGPEDIWKGLEGVDFSALEQGKANQYPKPSSAEIGGAFLHNPTRGRMLERAEDIMDQARNQAEGRILRQKGIHEVGWKVSIQTDNGLVGLWNSPLGDCFYLGYPGRILNPRSPEPENLVIKTLGVEKSRNLWGRFWGPLESTGGRVHVSYDLVGQYPGDHFPFVRNGELQDIYYPTAGSKAVVTSRFTQFSDSEPDAPTTNKEAVQKYRDRFITLSSEVALILGKTQAVTVEFGFVMVPEDLDREGYSQIEFLKGEWGNRDGYGKELVRGFKGDSTVFLKSGNSLVPWSTFLHIPVRTTSPQVLSDFIREDVLWF